MTEVKEVAVARSGLVMAAGTMTSRLLGLLRVVLLSGIIGATGLTAEAFQVANTLPNQFYLILAGGILNAVLVPQIIKADAHADGGQAFVNRIITLALMLLVAATTLTILAIFLYGTWLHIQGLVTIGEIVMESLARIDTVAYVRFASVYKNFQAADDFDKFVADLRPAPASEE